METWLLIVVLLRPAASPHILRFQEFQVKESCESVAKDLNNYTFSYDDKRVYDAWCVLKSKRNKQ